MSVAVVVIVSGFGIRGSGFDLGSALRVFLVEVAEDLLDAVLVLDRFVEAELELRDAAQTEPPADLAAEERRRALEGARGLLTRFRIAEGRVEDARDLQVRGDLHARQRDEADARVVDLA